ncbi:MAG: aminopeptidase-like protein [Alteromonadaceae bacterium]|jgi:aminopeptidase-like protein
MNLRSQDNIGERMYFWATELFPICRSLTGKGVRETLEYFQNIIPEMCFHKISSGSEVFDWTVPKEWHVNDAYIKNSAGKKVVDFKVNNLHLVGYSTPINKVMRLTELESNLYSLPKQPYAIPYITSYYKEHWGFCLTDEQKQQLPDDDYHVVIESELFDGVLDYADVIIKGETDEEILVSTYICHPSLANNELSGPVVTTALIQQVKLLPKRKYTYRFVFIPETIGAIVYLSRHLEHLQKNVIAGFVVTCIGDERNYSYLASREGNTIADKAALHTLTHTVKNFKKYDFLKRGSDERQYCAPGVDLPVCSIMRTRYGDYPEYHTSLDNLDLISAEGLAGGLNVLYKTILLLEGNEKLKVTVLCEPQLGKRGLYPTLSRVGQDYTDVYTLTNLITYCDGKRDLIDIADKLGVSAFTLIPIVKKLKDENLLTLGND